MLFCLLPREDDIEVFLKLQRCKSKVKFYYKNLPEDISLQEVTCHCDIKKHDLEDYVIFDCSLTNELQALQDLIVAMIADEYELYMDGYAYGIDDSNKLNEIIDKNNEQVELYGKMYNASEVMYKICKDLYRSEAVMLITDEVESFVTELLNKDSVNIYNNKFEIIEEEK